MNFESVASDLLEAVTKFHLAVRPWTPPPPSPRAWNPDDGSPTWSVVYRSGARSRSPSGARSSSPAVPAPPMCATAEVGAVTAEGSPVRYLFNHHIWRSRRGFREACPSPLTRLPPVAKRVARTGVPNPKYERVGDHLFLRQ